MRILELAGKKESVNMYAMFGMMLVNIRLIARSPISIIVMIEIKVNSYIG